MKILFVLDHYFPYVGGAETLFKNICEGLIKEGDEITVITTRIKATKAEETVNGVKIKRVWTPPFSRRYWFTFFAIPKVFRYARGTDIIHTTTYNSALSARIAGKITKKPNIITILEVLGNDWNLVPGIGKINAFFHKLFEIVVLKLNFDRFVCISKATKRNVLKCGIDEEKVIVNYPGVDYELFNPNNIDRSLKARLGLKKYFIYLFFGRPGITKGVDYLVRAVPMIAKKISNAKLVMILAHEPQNRYKQILNLIKKLKIRKQVMLISPVGRKLLPSYLGVADCIVVPSLTEGFGYTTAESAALGLKIVATNAGSLPEVVSGKYKIIGSKSPKEIAKGVYSMYKGKYEEIGLKKFTQDNSINELKNIYKLLMEKQDRPN